MRRLFFGSVGGGAYQELTMKAGKRLSYCGYENRYYGTLTPNTIEYQGETYGIFSLATYSTTWTRIYFNRDKTVPFTKMIINIDGTTYTFEYRDEGTSYYGLYNDAIIFTTKDATHKIKILSIS